MLTRLGAVRTLLKKRVHSDWAAIEHELHHLEEEVRLLLDADWHCTCHHGQPPHGEPATVTVRLYTTEEHTMSDTTDTFELGAPVYATATVDTQSGTELDDVPGTWTVSAADTGLPIGTVTQDTTNPEQARIDGLPAGAFNAVYTTASGVASPAATGTVADTTPASVTVALSATAPAEATAPAAA